MINLINCGNDISRVEHQTTDQESLEFFFKYLGDDRIETISLPIFQFHKVHSEDFYHS